MHSSSSTNSSVAASYTNTALPAPATTRVRETDERDAWRAKIVALLPLDLESEDVQELGLKKLERKRFDPETAVFTANLHVDDPRKFKWGTPEEVLCTVLRVWGVTGASVTDATVRNQRRIAFEGVGIAPGDGALWTPLEEPVTGLRRRLGPQHASAQQLSCGSLNIYVTEEREAARRDPRPSAAA